MKAKKNHQMRNMTSSKEQNKSAYCAATMIISRKDTMREYYLFDIKTY